MTTDTALSVPPIPISNPRLPALLLATALAPLACAQPPPPIEWEAGESEGETETEDDESEDWGEDSDSLGDSSDTHEDTTGSDTGELDDTLYPLVDGARWTYVVTNTFGQITDSQVIEAHETVWDGERAWQLVDEPGSKGNWDASTIIRDGDLTLRVHREELGNLGPTEILDYDPGFVRANDAWTTVGFKEERSYERTAYDGDGENPMVEARSHTYEVLAVDEQVTVPAGTFHCVKVERVRTLGAESGALAWFWFAPGVGKVREERPLEMEIEELVSVSIPGGANHP